MRELLHEAGPYLFIAAGVLGTFLFTRRYGSGIVIDNLEKANLGLIRRIEELEREDARKTRRIAELEARTDIALAVQPVLTAIQNHETEATRRADRHAVLLGMVAKQLGAEPGEVDAAAASA